jgi:hypothetical protein
MILKLIFVYLCKLPPAMKRQYYVCCIIFGCSLCACRKDNKLTGNLPSVYIIGSQQVANSVTGTTTYWKNGAPTVLADSNLFPQSIAVWGNDVYIAGSERGAIPVYFKNNIRNQFSGALSPVQPVGIVVYGLDVYITGVLSGSGSAYLKNGVFVDIPWKLGAPPNAESSGTAIAAALAVSSGNLYMTGAITDTLLNAWGTVPLAVWWENGNIRFLGPDAFYTIPSAIAVSDGDVYIAATRPGLIYSNGVYVPDGQDSAMYWKNGVPVMLGPGFASSIFIRNKDVYVSGITSDGSAVYWKNQSPVILSQSANTVGIVISGDDVYVAGNLLNYGVRGPLGVFWKNSVVDTLCAGTVFGITLAQ